MKCTVGKESNNWNDAFELRKSVKNEEGEEKEKERSMCFVEYTTTYNTQADSFCLFFDIVFLPSVDNTFS